MKLKKYYDCIVVGGGPGGVCAAAAAASRGASTLIIERYGFLGGMATAGLVNPFMAYSCNGLNLASPVFKSILNQLESRNALCSEGLIFDDEVLKYVLDCMMESYGVDVLFHTVLSRVDRSENSIKGIEILTKSGAIRLNASVYIDSTGDGDLASLAGVPYDRGRKSDNTCQPFTLCFRISGVSGDLAACELREELSDILTEAKKRKVIDQPREDVLVFDTLTPGTYHFNTTRVIGKDGTCSWGLTEGEKEGRRQTFELLDLFRKYSPRFSRASIVKMATQIGVRETRRVKGHYTLTEGDVLSARKFPDGIARSCYPVDIHNPDGPGTTLRHLPPNHYYEIPFRCLVPVSMKNLIIGSRCISSTHEAHSSLRVMPVVAAIGEAAGSAAAVVSSDSKPDFSRMEGQSIKQLISKECQKQTI
ncbi:MAG: FAD-dependent oxidoreductase [Chitinispirillaceae bacterium]